MSNPKEQFYNCSNSFPQSPQANGGLYLKLGLSHDGFISQFSQLFIHFSLHHFTLFILKFRQWPNITRNDTICVGKNTRSCIQYVLTLVLFTFCTCCILRCLVCIAVSCLVCIVVDVLCVLLLVVLCVLLASYVYFLHYMCIAVFTLDAGLLVRSQYSEGPATGHFDTGFSCFPCVSKQMLR